MNFLSLVLNHGFDCFWWGAVCVVHCVAKVSKNVNNSSIQNDNGHCKLANISGSGWRPLVSMLTLFEYFTLHSEHCQTSRTCLPSPNLWCALLLCPGEPLLIGPVINTIRGNINNLITMERNYLSQKDWAQDRVWSAEARGGPSLYAVPIKIAGLCPRHLG